MMFRLNTGMHVVAVQASKPTPMHVLHHCGVNVATKQEVDEARANALKYKDEYGVKKVMNVTDQHGVYSFYIKDYIKDLDLNWWEVQYAPNQHDDCFNADDVTPWDD
jgi:predicted lactoylglutathione lyase